MHSASAPQRKAPAFFAETLRDGLLLTSLPGAGGEGGCTDLLCFLKYYITPDAGCHCFFDVFARNFLPKACIFGTLAATLSAVRTVRRGGALHGELQKPEPEPQSESEPAAGDEQAE